MRQPKRSRQSGVWARVIFVAVVIVPGVVSFLKYYEDARHGRG